MDGPAATRRLNLPAQVQRVKQTLHQVPIAKRARDRTVARYFAAALSRVHPACIPRASLMPPAEAPALGASGVTAPA